MGTDFTVAEDLHRRTNTVTPSAGGLGTHEVGQAYNRQQQPANSQVFNSLVNTSGGRLHSVSQHIAFPFLIIFALIGLEKFVWKPCSRTVTAVVVAVYEAEAHEPQESQKWRQIRGSKSQRQPY